MWYKTFRNGASRFSLVLGELLPIISDFRVGGRNVCIEYVQCQKNSKTFISIDTHIIFYYHTFLVARVEFGEYDFCQLVGKGAVFADKKDKTNPISKIFCQGVLQLLSC